MKKSILTIFILYLPFQLVLPQIPVVNTLNFFLMLLLLMFIFGKNPQALRAKFDTPLLIFLIIWIISFLHSLFYPLGIWRYQLAVEFKRLITLVLGYYVAARCINTKKELQFLFYVFLFSVVLVGLHTFRNGMLAGPNFAEFKRSSGPFGVAWTGADIAGGFLAIFTPFLLSFSLLARRKILRLVGFIGLIICLAGLFATYSRGSIIALGIASFVTFLAAIKPLLRQSRAYAMLAMMLFIGAVSSWHYWMPQSIVNRMQDTFTQEVIREEPYYMRKEITTDIEALDESSQKRVTIWKAGLELSSYNPIIGLGFKIPQYVLGVDTHNAFIHIAAEMGILGILIFLWFLWRIFIQARSLLSSEFAILAVGFIGCISAFIFVNMFYSNFFRDTVVGTFWIMLGLLAASRQYAVE